MGCDIHSYVEEKRDGKWVVAPPIYESDRRYNYSDIFKEDEYIHCSSPIHDRNYAMFGFLAGVRRGTDTCLSIIDPTLRDSTLRGVPDDASPGVASEADYDGDHSHHWLTIGEIIRGLMAFELHYPEECDLFRGPFNFALNQIRDRMADQGLAPDEVRLVFWFDN